MNRSLLQNICIYNSRFGTRSRERFTKLYYMLAAARELHPRKSSSLCVRLGLREYRIQSIYWITKHLSLSFYMYISFTQTHTQMLRHAIAYIRIWARGWFRLLIHSRMNAKTCERLNCIHSITVDISLKANEGKGYVLKFNNKMYLSDSHAGAANV